MPRMQLKEAVCEHGPESKASLDVVPWRLSGFTPAPGQPPPLTHHRLGDPELLKIV